MTDQNQQPNSRTDKQETTSPANPELYGKHPSSVHPTKPHKKWVLPLKIILFPLFLLVLIWGLLDDGFEWLNEQLLGFGPYRKLKHSGFFGTLQLILGAILLAVVINGFVFQSYQVVGQSMSPTLSDGDRLLINKLGKSFASLTGSDFVPKRGDIIVFKSPISDERQLIKRVIGLPGDRVEFMNGAPTIFNDENPEGFNPDQDISDAIPAETNYQVNAVVGEGELFVAGDNRIGGASLDSRNDLGLVPTDNVVGTLVIRILPLDQSRAF